jgi:hypothetical protein
MVMIKLGRAPSPNLPRYAGEGGGRAYDPSPAQRGRVAERSETGWGRDSPAKTQGLKV